MKIPVCARLGAAHILWAACAPLPAAAGSFTEALTGGALEVGLRWRYEHVQDDVAPGGVPLQNADASTLRATLGYRTGLLYGFSAYGQIESVAILGPADFFDGSNGKRRFATVVDPAGTEVNEGYLAYQSAANQLRIRAGRQEITYRKAPFHRFIGTILWRQNWQTFDALAARVVPADDWELHYAYVWRVNRIFGEEAPEPLSHFEGSSHFLNIKYHGLPYLSLEAYAYLLDFDNAARFSANTVGLRGDGSNVVGGGWNIIYTGEYAYQQDAADNPASYAASYALAELGVKGAFNGLLKSLTVKLSYEWFEGDGTANGAFVSALGTNHPFQGWADRFLVTPDDGLQDRYVTATADFIHNTKLIVSFHDFDADRIGYDYGEELNVLVSKQFLKRYTFAAKAAFYDADRNAFNRSGGTSADVTKYWVWVAVTF